MRALAERLHLPRVPEKARHKRHSGAPRELLKFRGAVPTVEYPEGQDVPRRPRTRGDCYRSPRPCPFFSCRHHLGIDLLWSGRTVRVNFPDGDERRPSCSLDVAAMGALSLEYVAVVMNLTRESVRLIELAALEKLEAGMKGDVSHVGSEDDGA
jgi:hypothetical protein